MPEPAKTPNSRHRHQQSCHPLSIRDVLEKQVRIRYPDLARQLTLRKAGTRHPRRPKRFTPWRDRFLLALCAALLVLFVVRTEVAIAGDQQWGLQLSSDAGEITQLAVNTEVGITITGLMARVEVSQQFSNPGSQWAQGVYRFPLPDGAAVDRMRIRVGERILESEIQEKDNARRVYENALETGRTAGLVEQQRRNQFETRLANIGPGESIEITIGFLHNVSFSDYSYHLRLPMTFTPSWIPGKAPEAQQAGVGPGPQPAAAPSASVPPSFVAGSDDHKLRLHAELISTHELAAIESRYHDADIRKVENGYRITLLNPFEVTDRDFELSWTPALQSQPGASLTTFNAGDAVYAQLMLVPPIEDAISPQPREVILVVDTSGSMEGASLRQAKAALIRALDSLGPDDSFNLLQFNSITGWLFEEPAPVTQTSLYMARNFINGLRANGGTDMQPALKSALSMPRTAGLMRQVVFITDGAVGNESDLLQQVAADLGPSRMFTIAIGQAPNTWFMRKAAEIGRGSYIRIGKLEEVEQKMSALWSRIRLPALTSICVDWGEDAEYYPEVIPDLYAGEPLWLIARLPGEPTMIGLCGNLNGNEWRLDVNGWDAARDAIGGDQWGGSDNLAIMWARKKIEALEDSLMFGADRELIQLEITGLALDFGLLTRHTSLVAVDKTPRRSQGEALANSEIPALLPAGTSSRLAGYPNTATGWVSRALLSILTLVLASAMLWLTPGKP